MNKEQRQQAQNRPVFAVDIDNVLARAEWEVQRLYVELTGKPWPRGIYGSAGGLDNDLLMRDVVEKIFVRFHEGSIPHLPLLPSARMGLHQLEHRYRIVIITARRPYSRPQTLEWLQKHQIPFDELYHTEEKTDVPENISLAVDDHPLHALAYCELGIRVFLMDQPWNKDVDHPLLTRVSGWDDLLHMLDYGSVEVWSSTVMETPRVKSLLQFATPQVTQPTVEAS